jgi:hypothetical protein
MKQKLLSNGSVNNGRCQVMAATVTHATIEELLKEEFSVWSVTRIYKKGQLPLEESLETAVRRFGIWYPVYSHLYT